jgi:magnesium transporter
MHFTCHRGMNAYPSRLAGCGLPQRISDARASRYLTPMIRVLDLSAGKITCHESESAVEPPPEGVTRWVDVAGEDADGLETLRERFDFHPLAIEDCLQLDQRPKLEQYRDHLFLVTQSFTLKDSGIEVVLHELHAFLGERFLVTVHSDAIRAVEDVWQRVKDNAKALERGVDFVYYLIADRMVDANFPILDRIGDELEEIEDHVLQRPRKQDLAKIFELKRQLVLMRKVLSPQRDTMGMLSRGDDHVSERTSHYFRDVYDHLVRINESIEANRDLVGNALEAYLSAVSNRTNEIMKYLTILSAVFLPLAFVVGFFGQNFENLPGVRHWQQSDELMHAMIALCVLIPGTMVLWFKRQRWL